MSPTPFSPSTTVPVAAEKAAPSTPTPSLVILHHISVSLALFSLFTIVHVQGTRKLSKPYLLCCLVDPCALGMGEGGGLGVISIGLANSVLPTAVADHSRTPHDSSVTAGPIFVLNHFQVGGDYAQESPPELELGPEDPYELLLAAAADLDALPATPSAAPKRVMFSGKQTFISRYI